MSQSGRFSADELGTVFEGKLTRTDILDQPNETGDNRSEEESIQQKGIPTKLLFRKILQ